MPRMRPTSVLLATTVAGFSSAQRVIQADIWKPTLTSLETTNLTRRESPFNALLTQKPDHSLYWINITVGTPGQSQSLQLDTGSSALWVPSTGSAICSSMDCAGLGSFDGSASSTFSNTNQQTTVSFVDGSGVSGNWFYDTVSISGQAITSQLGILATAGSDITEGVLGVGFPASYPTLNHNMAAQGLIASNSYSIWLDDLQAAAGTILFGGLNTAKFSGVLDKMPIIGTTNSDGSTSYNQAVVQMTRIATLQGSTRTVQTSSTYSENVILDTGSTLTILQKPVADTIINAMGAQYYPPGSTNGTVIIPCSQASASLSVNFHFAGRIAGPTINVGISELVLQDLGSLNGIEMCEFGIYVSEDNEFPTILGDTFLRSAYVVYDLDTHHVGMAQTVFDSNAPSNILEISVLGIPIGVQT